jgi:drug/metabolite transporter (DMT)-like permease
VSKGIESNAPLDAASAQRRDNLAGIIAMLLAVACFALMDAGLKTLSPHYPPLEVAALRGLASFPLILLWVLARRGTQELLRVRWSLHLARAALGIAMLAGFAFGLRHLPLADAYSIFFVAPLLITALSVPLLGERVDARRWLAIATGLAGVLIVLRPTGAGVFTYGGAAVLGAAACYALSAIAVRILSRTDSTMNMVFWLTAMLSVGAGLLAWPQWVPLHDEHWRVLALVAVSGAFGQYAITEAFGRGQASVVAPLEYTALAWGLLLDWWVWRTFPDSGMLAGAAVIIASGIYLIRRERVHVEAEHP